MLEGERQQRRYTDKDGKPAVWDEIVADIISFTGERAKSSETDNQSDTDIPEEAYTPPELPDDMGDSLDDYPF